MKGDGTTLRFPSSRGQGTSIEILHHPKHAWNAERMVRSVQASLGYFTKEFGPYPHGQVRLVEHPGDGVSLHASPVNISYEEGFSLLNPASDPRTSIFRSPWWRMKWRTSGGATS